MSEDFVARNSTVKLGGISAVCAGMLLLGATLYLFLTQGAGQSKDVEALLQWVAKNTTAYKWIWVLFFLAQVFLMPVPYAVYCWLKADSTVRGGLLPLSTVFGVASCVLAIVGIVLAFAHAPIAADAFVKNPAGSAQRESALLIALVNLEVIKTLRLFSELLLAGWLIVTGMAMWPAHTKWSAAGVLVLGLYTLMATIIKIYSPLNPIEDTLGFVLAVGTACIGVGLVRAKFRI